MKFSFLSLFLFLICCGNALSNSDHADFEAVAYRRHLPAYILTNWKDSIITWLGPRQNPNQDAPIQIPGISSFKTAANFEKSGISADAFAIRVTNTKTQQNWQFLDPMSFDGDAAISAKSGIFTHYVDVYGSSQSNLQQLPVVIKRSYIFPPNEDFYIIQYSFEKTGFDDDFSASLLDFINTETVSPSAPIWGWFDNSTTLWMADETKSGGLYFATGSWSSPSSFALGSTSGPASPLAQFQNGSVLNNNTVYQGAQVQSGLVFTETQTVSSGVEISLFRTLQPDYKSCVAIATRARSKTPSEWLAQTALSYTQWLAQGKQPTTLSEDQLTFFQNALVSLKNSQNPKLGTFVASSHPAYGYKVWARDGAYSAMIMDNAGYHKEAESYLKWMASAQLRPKGMGFHTCYDWYTGAPVSFVEPEYDASGVFITASYMHYLLTNKDQQFLQSVYPQIKAQEDFFLQNVEYQGFIPADYSIWEESSDPVSGNGIPPSYFTFTQSMAFLGLFCGEKVELLFGNSERAGKVHQRGLQVKQAIETALWMSSEQAYARAIWSNNNQLDSRIDSSTAATIWTGLANSTRATSHLKAIFQNLTRLDNSGIARYWDDIFFYKSKFNPGGQEVSGPMPVWPVVTMFTAWASLTLKQKIEAPLALVAKFSAPMHMPIGEAMDGSTGLFVMSSCMDYYESSGVYVWTVLMNENQAM